MASLGDRPHVRIDDVEAARQATHHLILAGHERVALINATGRWRLPYAGPQDRFQGYLDALRDADLPVEQELVVQAEWGSSGGADAMARLLSLPRPPTAVVAFSDEMAFGALRTLRRSGIAVPHTVSLVGIDDHEMADVVELTTVRQPVLELGREAGDLVFRLLKGGDGGGAARDAPDAAGGPGHERLSAHSGVTGDGQPLDNLRQIPTIFLRKRLRNRPGSNLLGPVVQRS